MEPQKPNKSTAAKTDLVIQMKTLKTYQPVEFNKNLEKYFKTTRPGMEGLTIEFNVTQQIIYLRQPDKGCRIVVPANVEYMEPV